jgi:hypothetical protein
MMDECKNYSFWHNTIPNANAVLWSSGTTQYPTRVLCSGDVKTSNEREERLPIVAVPKK